MVNCPSKKQLWVLYRPAKRIGSLLSKFVVSLRENGTWVAMKLPNCTKMLVLLACSIVLSSLHAQKQSPNIVFILVDDLGWMDIGANGSSFYETPNIDQLAKEGMRFTQAYAASPICSPTRASILTGKNPARIDLTQWIGGPGNPDYKRNLPLEEVLFPELLQAAGYTTAFMGKWHLNNKQGEETFWPDKQGFDINIAGHFRGGLYIKNNYFSPWDIPNLENGPEGQYMTDRLADEAVDFIDANSNKPFLLYFSLYSVHAPFKAPAERVEKYTEKKEKLGLTDADRYAEEIHGDKTFTYRKAQDHPTYAAMVESMDMAIGKVIDKLKSKEIADNTVIIFFSDNGGLSTSEGIPTANTPLRAGKGWLYEGGIREPAIVKWPGVVTPNTVSNTLITSMDFYPTILEMTGQPLRPNLHQDGKSIVPILKGDTKNLHESTYFHYPHRSNQKGSPCSAIREGDHKLLVFLNDNTMELYNLKNDIMERHNLASTLPELKHHLYKKLYSWWNEVDAKFPKEFTKISPKD